MAAPFAQIENGGTIYTWVNPHGAVSRAIIDATGTVTELTIQGASSVNMIYTQNPVDIEHIKTVLTDLVDILNT